MVKKSFLTIDKLDLLIKGFKEKKEEDIEKRKIIFQNLLEGYQKVFSSVVNKVETLIKGFKEKGKEYIEKRIFLFKNLLTGYFETFKKFREKQRRTAEDINIFDILEFTYDEMRHSKFLAYLFDPLGTHAQGNLFFKIFLKEVGLPEEYSEIDYKVKTEVVQEESRIDIEIISKKGGENGFIIHIENKVGDPPKKEQIEREYRDLLKKANTIGISENRIYGFLLSIKKPEEKIPFKWIGWDKIAKCLKTFKEEAQAQNVKFIIKQYLECVEKNIIKERMKKEKEEENEEIE